MADRLSAAEFALLGGNRMRATIAKTVEVSTNKGSSWTDVTPYVVKFGKCRMSLANRHPITNDSIKIPGMTIQVNNKDLLFTAGTSGGFFANNEEFRLALWRCVLTIEGTNRFSFTGRARDPKFGHSRFLNVELDHVLDQMYRSSWKREHRIGGDTGEDITSNT
jgi:hypothetical protein